jgi:hypothetical protein
MRREAAAARNLLKAELRELAETLRAQGTPETERKLADEINRADSQRRF